MKTKKKIIPTLILIVITLFFILPAVGFSILNWGVLPPEKLTPLIIRETNKFLDAHLECERIELTYFETWPYLGVQLTNGRLISHIAEDPADHNEGLSIPSDSLLRFSKAVISLQPADYMFSSKVTIKEFVVDSLRFYGHVNKKGRANWDIYKSQNDSSASSGKEPLPPIDLQKVRITNGHFTYDDQHTEMFADIDGFFLTSDGSLYNGKNTLDIETGASSTFFSSPTYTLSNKMALKLKSQLLLSDNFNTVTLKGAELTVNNLPFTANGSISSLPDSGLTQINMDMGLKISDLNDLLQFIPESYFQNRNQTIAKGQVTLEGSIHGSLGDTIVPTVNLCCKVEKGSYHVKGVKQGIDTLEMDLDLYLNGVHPDSSYASLEQLTMRGLNTSLEIKGTATNLIQNPAISTIINGKIDFTRLAHEFLNPDTLFLEGIMEANLSASFTMDDLLKSQYGKIKASGKLNIDELKAFSDPMDMDVYIKNSHFIIDSVRQKSEYLNSMNLLNILFSVDSMNIKYKNEISTNISKLDIQARTSPVIDTTAVIPLTANISFNYLRTLMPDSVWLVAGKTVMKGGIKPSASNKQIPTAGATISIDTLKYYIAPMQTGLLLAENTFNIEALPLRDARLQQRLSKGISTTGTDSSRMKQARMALTDRTQVDTTSATSQFFRKWEVRGSVLFKQMRAFSRLLPLPIQMDPTTVQFTTNDVTLKDAHLQLGKSNFTLNGEIIRIRQAMLRGGKLKGEFFLTSDYLDCNQLVQALNSGMLYAEQLNSTTGNTKINDESIVGLDTNAMQDSLLQATIDTTDQLLILPEYLDITLHTNAKRIDFKDLELENVTGEVILRDQSINLNNLNMHSNIGCGNLTMVYTAKNKRGASTGFDLNMEDIKVERLIGLFPPIDTLVPMLRSFQGVVDCQVTATCNIDSTMSLLLPSLHSACYLHGEKMVLLDGETFAEISKTLMFKNKKQNVIDSISVDLSIKDNKIEVFPFLVEMDRYKVAVGGTHNMDMTFNYHLSVLKSPVPFKLGIDITGNLDDFKYKIVKCRYKDILKPTREAQLDSTRVSLRNEIREAIRNQIKKAAPELAGSLTENNTHTHSQEQEQSHDGQGAS